MPVIDLTELNKDYYAEVDKLLLLSGQDIPIPELKLTIHQPLLSELALLNEGNYLNAASMFSITADALLQREGISEQETMLLKNSMNLDIIFSFLKSKQSSYLNFCMLLLILFPKYQTIVDLESETIKFIKLGTEELIVVNKLNFRILAFYVKLVFNIIKEETNYNNYNPQSDHARKIMERMKQNAEKIAKLTHKGEEGSSPLCNAISSVSAALHIPIREVYDKYTLIQLYDQLNRFRKYEEYHHLLSATLAGAKDVDIQNWMGNI